MQDCSSSTQPRTNEIELRSSEIFDEKVMTFNVYFIELDFDNWLSFLLTLKGIL